MTCIIVSGDDEIYRRKLHVYLRKYYLLLDIFLDDHLDIPLLSRLERLDVGGLAVLLQGGGAGPGLDHGPPVISPRLPVQIIVHTASLGLRRK